MPRLSRARSDHPKGCASAGDHLEVGRPVQETCARNLCKKAASGAGPWPGGIARGPRSRPGGISLDP
ncbi:MAG: hypothetical protein AVDCRST_MAG47-1341 [uncultured Nocardioidaceae bacterium]|uniref:Uncharacterized protein n=1 Tax=uncultured Nocardioidaceae bacterium TaxID=253824 RepID=A0A6J4MY11_9ACTN|nr:MAG: hypothetical protein AVDCRST_MAG47-1341 [uncultured Nocardioidaceae bacterium]